MQGHGYGYPPPPAGRPSDGMLITLRVIFISLSVLSCSLLAWAPMLRLAIVTRKALDWALFGLTIAANIGLLVFAGVYVPEGDEELSDGLALTILGWITIVMVGSIVYYVTAETRHYERLVPRSHTGHGLPQPTGYGYPPAATPPSAANPYAGPVQQSRPPVPPRPPAAGPAPEPAPAPGPGPAPGLEPNSRIDQVRAELDELSDFLRKEPRPDGGDR